MTLEFFNEQMARLTGLRFRPSDFQSHWEALRLLPDDALDAAVTRAMSSQSDFPTPHELLTYADLVRPSRSIVADDLDRRTVLDAPKTYTVGGTALSSGTATVQVREEWRYDCDRCNDGGQVSYWCADHATPPPKPWYIRRTCERRNAHYAHEFVGPCACAQTNPTIQRRLESRRKFAAEPAQKRGAA